MSTKAVEQLKTEASLLSVDDRADLAYFLLTTMEPSDEDVEASWEREIDRRVAEIRAGTAVGRPVEDVLAELRLRHP